MSASLLKTGGSQGTQSSRGKPVASEEAYEDRFFGRGNKARKFRHELRMGRILPRATKFVIGNYKEPLTPYKDGYGYVGALVYDKSENFTQCHECGYFFPWLPFHVKRAHDISSRDYKDKFQLNRKTSLLSANARRKFIQSSTFTHWTEEDWEQHKERLKDTAAERSARLTKLNQAGLSQRPKSLEQKNIEGRCPAQLLDKIKVMADDTGTTPKRRDFAKRFGTGYERSVKHTFGSWNEAIKILGLTPNKPGKTTYTKESLLEIIRAF